MNKLYISAAFAILLAILFGILTHSSTLSIALCGVIVAVVAEINISLHRRDHDRKQKERRAGTWS